MIKDKIFWNSFNEGTLNIVSDTPIEIDRFYRANYLEGEYESEKHIRLENLIKKVHSLIENNDDFSGILKNKKIIKKLIPNILEFLLDELHNETDISFTEKFYAICEILDIRESIIYEALPPFYKQEALKEISKYTSIKKQEKFTKLF